MVTVPIIPAKKPLMAPSAIVTPKTPVPQPKAAHVATKDAGERAFTMEDMDEAVSYRNYLFYGPPGSGKTTLAATAADVDDMADVFMADIESGQLAIKDNDRIEHPERISRASITSYRQMAAVHEYLKAHCRLRDSSNPEAKDKLRKLEAKFRGCEPGDIKKVRRFKTCIVDSLSELDTLTQYELLGIKTDFNLEEMMNDGDVEVADWPIFRKNNQLMQAIIRSFRNLPMHVIFNCHRSFTQDEAKRFHYSPALTGKLGAQAQGFVDIVGFLQVGELGEGKTAAPRRLMVSPVGKFDAKCRIASYKKAYFDNPVMADIWNVM